MLNLDKLLENMAEAVTSYRSSLNITDTSVSLSSRANYYRRLNNKIVNHISAWPGSKRYINKGFTDVSTFTITTADGGTGTVYYWFETSSISMTSERILGLYLMYNGPVTTLSSITGGTSTAGYFYFDIALPSNLEGYIASDSSTVSRQAIVHASIMNNRTLGAHGNFNGTSTLRIYVYTTNDTAYSNTTNVNLFVYLPTYSSHYHIK